MLSAPAVTGAQLARKGEVYRQILSLLLAGRRPAYYLVDNRAALAALTDNYLRLIAAAGIIDPELRDAALHAELHFRTRLPPAAAMSFVGNKATERLRDRLVSLLHLPDLYALDRLDLTGYASVDTPAERRVTDRARRARRSRRHGRGCRRRAIAFQRGRASGRRPGRADARAQAPIEITCAFMQIVLTSRSTSIRAPSCSSARPPNCAL